MQYKIKETCKSKNVAIGELANIIGIERETLSRIINGGNTSTGTLQKIADALGVSVVELFDEPRNDVFQCPKCGTTLVVKEN